MSWSISTARSASHRMASASRSRAAIWRPENSSVMTADVDGGNQKRLAAGNMDSTWFAGSGVSWSPDGKRLAVMQGSVAGGYHMRPVIIDVATGAMEPLGSTTWVELGRPVWLPDGSGVLFPARERSEGAFQFWIARYPGGEAARITNDARGFGDMQRQRDRRWIHHRHRPLGHRQQPVQHDARRQRAARAVDVGRPDRRRVGDGGIGRWTDCLCVRGRHRRRHLERRRAGRASAPADPRLRGDTSSPDDGRFIAYQAIHEGRFRIWRMERGRQRCARACRVATMMSRRWCRPTASGFTTRPSRRRPA